MTVSRRKEQGKKPLSKPQTTSNLKDIYPQCKKILDVGTWKRLCDSTELKEKPELFPGIIAECAEDLAFPDFLADLAQLELALHFLKTRGTEIPAGVEEPAVNPTLQILELKSKNLAALVDPDHGDPEKKPGPGGEMVLVWRHPETGSIRVQEAFEEDLLALKMLIENIDADEIAAAGGVPIGAVDMAVDRAVDKGLILRPESRIRRDTSIISVEPAGDQRENSAEVFTLQWHVTQACDLHCKHCYDRSDRSPLKMDQALKILDDFRAFCRSRYVHGQVSFSGGNPLLYPNFTDLYRATSERGMGIAILGNPATRVQLEKLAAIQHPGFFQVSLEGLREHNDMIRGSGHFDRVIEFLKVLRDLEIYSMVMLTLTKENINQVLPLSEKLRDLADHLTFNRLSMVGEGANLQLPQRDEFRAFLEEYLDASENNPILGLKDNLINIVCSKRGTELMGGCTGFGCGAAFNFLTLLPDGEVHACRKFPSLMGNAFEESLSDIYDSEIARRYRAGTDACTSCVIRPTCGGCLAISYSHGLDIFRERDPFCFIEDIEGANIKDSGKTDRLKSTAGA
ncbi:thio(seleno)oxazole modification radical SAM maturase SbtM [Thermodesulfobacteriota bacterium]